MRALLLIQREEKEVKNKREDFSWRFVFTRYNARPLAAKAQGEQSRKAAKERKEVGNTGWRSLEGLYNAPLSQPRLQGDRNKKFFKIQIKQPISVGMCAEVKTLLIASVVNNS